eukprot:354955-Chlamydomonas_euryale.AAC.4
MHDGDLDCCMVLLMGDWELRCCRRCRSCSRAAQAGSGCLLALLWWMHGGFALLTPQRPHALAAAVRVAALIRTKGFAPLSLPLTPPSA